MLCIDLLFYVFSISLLLCACMVVLSTHPVYSLLFLLLSFIFASFLLFLLECEFLALLFLLVYAGAIAILFLFAVMMLETKSINLQKNSQQYFPFILVYFFLFLAPMLYQINVFFGQDPFRDKPHNFFVNFRTPQTFFENHRTLWYDLQWVTNDVTACGKLLYSTYVLQFLLAGLILLLVLVSVVHLTSFPKQATLQQSTFRQLSRQAKIF